MEGSLSLSLASYTKRSTIALSLFPEHSFFSTIQIELLLPLPLPLLGYIITIFISPRFAYTCMQIDGSVERMRDVELFPDGFYGAL
jgi:hypothetical protein